MFIEIWKFPKNIGNISFQNCGSIQTTADSSTYVQRNVNYRIAIQVVAKLIVSKIASRYWERLFNSVIITTDDYITESVYASLEPQKKINDNWILCHFVSWPTSDQMISCQQLNVGHSSLFGLLSKSIEIIAT